RQGGLFGVCAVTFGQCDGLIFYIQRVFVPLVGQPRFDQRLRLFTGHTDGFLSFDFSCIELRFGGSRCALKNSIKKSFSAFSKTRRQAHHIETLKTKFKRFHKTFPSPYKSCRRTRSGTGGGRTARRVSAGRVPAR